MCAGDALLLKGDNSRWHDAGPQPDELPMSFDDNLPAVWMVDGDACHPCERDFRQTLLSSRGMAHPPIHAYASVLRRLGVHENAQRRRRRHQQQPKPQQAEGHH